MKKTYDIEVDCAYHSVSVYEYGFFEEICTRNNRPFDPNNYVTVECNSAFYRVEKAERYENEIADFLISADEAGFQVPVEGAEPDRAEELARELGLPKRNVQEWLWGRRQYPW